MSKIKMYPVNLVIMQIQIQTKEGMNEYKQYRKKFFMESANRVGGREHGQNLVCLMLEIVKTIYGLLLSALSTRINTGVRCYLKTGISPQLFMVMK